MSSGKKSFKVVMIGDSNVGKTSIVHWFLYNRQMPYENCPTIGAAFSNKDIIIDNNLVNMQVWDTAGQERYKTFTKLYYRNSIACLCVFDLSNKYSFQNLKSWIDNFRENNNLTSPTIIIVGNKADLPKEKWQVSKQEISDFITKENCKFISTECIKGTNTTYLFKMLGRILLNLPMNMETNIDDKEMEKSSKKNIIRVTADKFFHMNNKENCKC